MAKSKWGQLLDSAKEAVSETFDDAKEAANEQIAKAGNKLDRAKTAIEETYEEATGSKPVVVTREQLEQLLTGVNKEAVSVDGRTVIILED